MINPIIKYHGTHCPRCNKETVMAYDAKNKPIPFAVRVTTTTDDIMNNLNNVTLSYMKCTDCGATYFIDYSLGFARPVAGPYIRDLFFSK